MINKPTLLGTVQDVNGAKVGVHLSTATLSGMNFVEGAGYRVGQLGSFVRIPIGYVDLFGLVTRVGASAIPEHYVESEVDQNCWMTVQLVGESFADAGFQRGLSQYPTVGEEVHLVTERELHRIYGNTDSPGMLQIGTIASAQNVPSLVNVNKLVSRHCAVLGMTGAGKSTTVASLLNTLSDPQEYPSSRILVVDLHGEYARALNARARVFKIADSNELAENERALSIPYWMMTFDEFADIALGDLDDASRAYVAERIIERKRENLTKVDSQLSQDSVEVDTPIPFSIRHLWYELYRDVNATHTAQRTGQSRNTEAIDVNEHGDLMLGDPWKVAPPKYVPATQARNQEKVYMSGNSLPIKRNVELLQSRLRDPRFDAFLKPGRWDVNRDCSPGADIDELLEEWVGGEEPVTILDLSGVPQMVMKTVVGTVLRIIYDALFWARNLPEGGRERPIFVVLEEAHGYLQAGDRGSASAVVRRVVKEGRKYGVGVMVVSQRPAEIDPTILSQCGTLFALRLSNSSDRGQVKSTVADGLEGLLEMLPTLRTGEVIIVGEAVHLPSRTIIAPPPPERRPDSEDPLVHSDSGSSGWNATRADQAYKDVAAAWRRHSAIRREKE